ncbi:hypothetical protein Zmor_019815 [Zophobas morio]|uniref:Glucosylceramidase n=2 Tax=Zophobas morio TaxID=2755281 RepID=A0AA38I2U7_9CUCU|nr:hypothetical protein Zmor_019815 [Zophobas morio]
MLKLYFLLTFFVAVSYCQDDQECLSRDYGYGGTVCVCNSDHCDTIARPDKVDQPQYLIYTSNKAGLRFHKDVGEFTTSDSSGNQIVINPDQQYQEIFGWGGAFTDATGINIASLDEALQEKLLRSYFAEDGIEYNVGRVPIGGTDFSTHGYSYDDGEEDLELANFAIADEDFQYKIPYIKKGIELSESKLELFASAWTAPKWMKTNGEYAGFGYLKEEAYQTWADYFVKFLDGYQDEDIHFWGITTGNEPHTILVPGNKINTVGWNATELGKWIQNNLGPTIRTSDYWDIQIMVHDDQRLFLPAFVDSVLENQTAADYIDGIAVHWYTDFFTPPSYLTDTHDHFPSKFIISTEACNEVEAGIGPVVLGSWDRGELYSKDILEVVTNWGVGWVDWNMVLDEAGGPTYINNTVDAPIIVNATGGEFYKQPMFYHMGHFSKFVPRPAVRVETVTNVTGDVVVAAFHKPSDDGIVVVLLNKEESVVPISLVDETRGTAQLELSEKSITTILYW